MGPIKFSDGSPNPGQKAIPSVNKDKRICHLVNFVVPANHSMKIKKNQRDNYLNLVRELKKLWNMSVTVIPLVVGALVTVPRG